MRPSGSSALHVDFVQAIRTKEWVGREARDAAMCVQLIETAYASARAEGRELEISPARTTERAAKAG